jgi:outer membrane immunogenic protein
MRIGLALVATAVIVTAASTAVRAADVISAPEDMSIRGSITEPLSAPTNFTGYYIGAFGGYGTSDMNLRDVGQKATRTLYQKYAITGSGLPSDLFSFGEDEDQSTVWGAYAGVNYQYEDVTWGFEVDYTHADLSAKKAGTQFGAFNFTSNGSSVSAAITDSVATARIRDYITLRGRAGYVTGIFMPYLTAGLAIAKTDVTSTATAVTTSTTLPILTTSYVKKEKYNLGVAAGLGVDVAVTPNVVLRGEYQLVYLPEINGAEASIHTVRAGGALKF